MVQITGAVARTKTEVQSRGQKRCHEELTYRKFNLPRCHCSRPPVRIEQRFPKPRVGSSTLPRPTTLILSFSWSSTIPSIRRNAPKWCKCHKSVIVFSSRRDRTDQNESRPATLLLSVDVDARNQNLLERGAVLCCVGLSETESLPTHETGLTRLSRWSKYSSTCRA